MAINIGARGLRSRGAYSASVTYYTNDVVVSDGGSYVAIATTTGNPPTDTANWTLVAQAGQAFSAGGTTGQAYTKSSGTNFDAAWTAAPAIAEQSAAWAQPNYVVNYWYDTRMIATNVSNSNVPCPSGTAYYMPFFLAKPTTVDSLGLVTATVTNTVPITLGVLSASGSGYPGNLLASASMGTPTATNTAYFSGFSSIVIPAGLNYAACYGSGATYNLTGNLSYARPLMGWSSLPTYAQATGGSLTVFSDASFSGLVSNPTVTPAVLTTTPVIWFRPTVS